MDCLTLSIVIITQNEEANLARTLPSVAWADEVVVLDSGSTDRTREIAESLGISMKTVQVYCSRIKEKLSLKTANELLREAMRWWESRNQS